MTEERATASAPFGIPGVDHRDLVMGIQEGLWLVDADGLTAFVNDRMAALLDLPAAQILGRSLLEFFAEADQERVLLELRRRHDGRPGLYEADLRRADGSLVRVQVHAGPLMRDGQMVASLAAITDLTEANALKARFLSWVSHELRTPLNAMSGFAQLLQARATDPAERAMADHIVAASGRIDALVRDLLDHSRGDTGTIPAFERELQTAAGQKAERLVLYVEDEPLNATLVTTIVGMLPGRTVEVAGTVADGLAALRRRSPALVLLDLNLPDGSGLEVLLAVRADARLRGIPVFVLSADPTQQAAALARDAGADGFITKPLKVNDFLKLVDAATS